jgi:hypothetical protein
MPRKSPFNNKLRSAKICVSPQIIAHVDRLWQDTTLVDAMLTHRGAHHCQEHQKKRVGIKPRSRDGSARSRTKVHPPPAVKEHFNSSWFADSKYHRYSRATDFCGAERAPEMNVRWRISRTADASEGLPASKRTQVSVAAAPKRIFQ